MHAAHSPPPPLTPRPPPPSTSSPPRYMGAVHFYPSPCPPSRFNFSYRFAFDAGRCNASFLGLGIIYFPFVLKALIHNSYSANLFASVCALLLLFTACHGGVSELRRLAAMEIFSEGKGNRINVLGATIFKRSTLVPNRAAWQARKQEPWLLYLDSVFLHPRPLHTLPRRPLLLHLLPLLLLLDAVFANTSSPLLLVDGQRQEGSRDVRTRGIDCQKWSLFQSGSGSNRQ